MVKALKASIFFLLFVASLSSCKKVVEDKKRNLLIQIMTDGTWRVTGFLEGTVDITSEFTGYNFQFKENGTVTSNHNSIIDQGAWVGDVNNYSISSNFPSAVNPLLKFNGVWKLIDSSNTTVKAEMNTSTGKKILNLAKN